MVYEMMFPLSSRP